MDNVSALRDPWSSIAPDLSRTARSRLAFRRDPQGKSYIASQRTEYPFHMTRPFRLPDDPAGMLTLYLQSSSGGLYRGDQLTLEVEVEEQAAVHLTTQAGTVVHHTREGNAKQTTRFTLDAGSYCEYLPDPLILFSGADLSTRTHAVLAADATLLLADAFSTHDPDDDGAPFKRLQNELRIERDTGEILAIDRFDIEGASFSDNNTALQGNQRNHGTLIVIAPGDLQPALKGLRSSISATPGVYGGASMLPNNSGLWCRFLADDGVALSTALRNAWIATRTAFTGLPPVMRRK